jgi:hypothetical protein
MIINLVPQPHRSLAAVRRCVVRCGAGMLITVMVSSLFAFVIRSATYSLRRQMGSGQTVGGKTVSSQIAACRAEQDSLQRMILAARETCRSWRRPNILLAALTTGLPAEIWLQRVSIKGPEIELIGAVRGAHDIERLLSSPDVVRVIENVRIVSTRSEGDSGDRVFQVSATAPVSSACGDTGGGTYADG